MKNIKQFLVSLILALFLATISIGIGYTIYKRIEIIKQNPIMKVIEISVIEKKPSYKYLKSVTVRILQTDERGRFVGTGTIIKITDKYTYILTNKHMAPMENKDNITVMDENRIEIKAEILRNCTFADLSLIRVKGKISEKRVIKGIGRIEHSDKVYSVGMYLGYYDVYTEGTMAGYDFDNNFVMNLPGAGGCSGSGVFNQDGKLVALVFAGNYINFPFQVETAKLLCINTWKIEMFLFQTEDLIE